MTQPNFPDFDNYDGGRPPATPDGWDATIRYTGIPTSAHNVTRVTSDTPVNPGHIALKAFVLEQPKL